MSLKQSLPNPIVEKLTTNEIFTKNDLVEEKPIENSTFNFNEDELNNDVTLNEKKSRKSYSSLYFNNQESSKIPNQNELFDVKKNLSTDNFNERKEQEALPRIIDNNFRKQYEFINDKPVTSKELETSNKLVVLEKNELLKNVETKDSKKIFEKSETCFTNPEIINNKPKEIIKNENEIIYQIENKNLENKFNNCDNNISGDLNAEIKNWEAEDLLSNIISKKNSNIFDNVKFDNQATLESKKLNLPQSKFVIFYFKLKKIFYVKF